ncbi:MAG: 30S ribosomal protein S10 [Patescibacteria group bacterium]
MAKDNQSDQGRLRIKISAYEHKLLDDSVQKIIEAAHRVGAEVAGPIPMPTKMKKYTVNRSTFIYNTSREQYEMRIHSRLIDVLNPSTKITEALTNLSLPSGVSIEVKMI